MQAEGTFWAQIVILIITVITLGYHWFADARRRTWERQDAADKAIIAERLVRAEKTLTAKVDENTAFTKKALTEANRFNLKLLEQNARFDRILATAADSGVANQATSERIEGKIDASDLLDASDRKRNA